MDESLSVLEFGSLDINGSVRSVFEGVLDYTGLDMADGPGVDVVADAATYRHPKSVDIIVCCEVFEHAPSWRRIVHNAYRTLRKGGLFVATMAGEGRAPHSAIDENPIRPWEFYCNVAEGDLLIAVLEAGFGVPNISTLGNDLRVAAVK
jgi:SAM-dependent methyltransferase